MLTAIKNGFAVALAWPETKCKQAGAWYDGLMRLTGFNKCGYYRVGHAALLLISDEKETCEYFDFGRYHAPHGFGRVRDRETDHDLEVITKPIIARNKKTIENMDQILWELSRNHSCHGDGTIYASCTRIDYDRAFARAKKMQQKDFIAYGPFKIPGTNCSRFVNQIVSAGCPSILEFMALKIPYSISPTPMTNIRSLNSKLHRKSADSETISIVPINMALR